jgi:hypothetical protein
MHTRVHVGALSCMSAFLRIGTASPPMALRNECPKWATSDEALGRDGTKLYGLINRRAPRWRNSWRESSRRGLLVGADRVVEQGLATSPINRMSTSVGIAAASLADLLACGSERSRDLLHGDARMGR